MHTVPYSTLQYLTVASCFNLTAQHTTNPHTLLPLQAKAHGFTKKQTDRCLQVLAEKGHINATHALKGVPYPNIKGVVEVIIFYSIVDDSLLGRSLS